jgi:predicted Zn-dependent protease
MMADAGYDPAAAARFWNRMITLEQGRAQRLEFLSTHPADDDRLIALAVEIERFTALQAQASNDSGR